ncbi:uncharacterized protein [Diabrotica undecimpunctata]|uniref:uncharacterized protein n=1 Tax=Diabrotica undecimpunctata TaxID=50387 RepID=UPI003B638E98
MSTRRALNCLKILTQQDQSDEESLIETENSEIGINNPTMEDLQDVPTEEKQNQENGACSILTEVENEQNKNCLDPQVDKYQGGAAEYGKKSQEMDQNIKPTGPPCQGNDVFALQTEIGVAVHKKVTISHPQEDDYQSEDKNQHQDIESSLGIEMEMVLKKRKVTLHVQVNTHQSVTNTVQNRDQYNDVLDKNDKVIVRQQIDVRVTEEKSQNQDQDGAQAVTTEDEDEHSFKIDLKKKKRKVTFHPETQVYHYFVEEDINQSSSDEDYTGIENVLGRKLFFHPIPDGYGQDPEEESCFSAFCRIMEEPCTILTMIAFFVFFILLPMILAGLCLYFGLFHSH